MKTFGKALGILMSACLCMGMLTACGSSDESTTAANQTTEAVETSAAPLEEVDYASAVTLNMGSSAAKQEVTVHTYVDGDTVHFNVPSHVNSSGVLKARFLAVNTPESTGKIEEYGKRASEFTKQTLSAATSIYIESETDKWNADSTGGRYLVWVWYKTAETEEYRNLNIELLQNGLALPNSSANNKYGSTCMSAIDQAKAMKLSVYSGQKDPDFFYGDAIELSLKELRANVAAYNGMKVAFNGIITMNDNNSVYVESYDPETDMHYGITVYYGFGLSGTGLSILAVGNEARIVGSVQYYEAGGIYQISDVSYRMMKPDDPGNIQKLSDGHTAPYTLTEADTFVNGTVEVVIEDTTVSHSYASMAMDTSIEMRGLSVVSVEDRGANEGDGVMVLQCQSGEANITVCLADKRDAEGNRIPASAYEGKTIDVKGYVDFFDGAYQIKVFSDENIVTSVVEN